MSEFIPVAVKHVPRLGSNVFAITNEMTANDFVQFNFGKYAALFSAAPEMLEALKTAHEVISRFMPSSEITWNEVHAIRDAIAKAEGMQK